MSDYQGAVQSPSFALSDAELKNGTAVTNKLGLPKPICGQFASVYELETGDRRYAAKFFLRNIPDQHDRYARISEHLNRHKTPYFVTFEYQSDGILVHGERYPLVKMEWIEGLALNQFIEKNLSSPETLLALEARWLELLKDLHAVDIAHGDLQHGNVLVVGDGSLRLIDYDGMWVPALEGQTSHETGHPDFQSPVRTARDFHGEIDLFSGAVVQIAIRALSKEPELWERYDNGDNLLFRRQDYLNPSESCLVSELKALGDDVVGAQLELVIQGCARLPQREKDVAERTKVRRAGKGRKSKAEESKEARTPKQAKKGSPSSGGTAAGTQSASESRAEAAARPAAGQSSPSWIGDHVAGYRAEAPARSRKESSPAAPQASAPRRSPGILQFALHAVVMAPVVSGSVAEWIGFLSTDAEAMARAHEIVFGIASFLGVLSLGSLVVFRKCHGRAGALFFGFMVLLSVYDLAAKLWTIGALGTMEEHLVQYGFGELLLILSAVGWILRADRD